MPERPLLLFPSPTTADRENMPPGFGRFQKPSRERQGERLAPKFEQLQNVFEGRRAELLQSTQGTEPEEVLVIETVGSVSDFVKAVNRIDGLEWMGELELDDIAPDEDFYVDNYHRDKKLSGRLYLVMSNQQALGQMLSLWNSYKNDSAFRFGTGLTKFRDVFLQLKDIRRWGVQDRLYDTKVLEYWREELQNNPDRVVRFEAELWYRENADDQHNAQQRFSRLVAQSGGRIVGQSVIGGIAYHGVLAELPAQEIGHVIASPDTELVKCEHVMFFRPAGQIVVGHGSIESAAGEVPPIARPIPVDPPLVALFDGMPLENHSLLENRLMVDDPDNFATDYAAGERVHGTSIASLIIHGDLTDNGHPIRSRLYMRPIMKPQNWIHSPRPEAVPDDVLFVDLLHRAIRRLFEGDGTEAPVAPTVKIINLSIGDPFHPFEQTISPEARLLDWLSAKYNVLFIVSAGNHSEPLQLHVSARDFNAFQPTEREELVVRALFSEIRNRRILSPAETINGLTVGALHHDSSTYASISGRTNVFQSMMPSPISAFGGGCRRSIKPDIVHLGGRQLFDAPIQSPVKLTIPPITVSRYAPGNKSASPSITAGITNAENFSCGTSNATALMSRAAITCLDSLLQLLDDQRPELAHSKFTLPLLKAMLVHGCSWGDIGEKLKQMLSTSGNGVKAKSLVARWLGYGEPNINRVLECTERRATLLGYGELLDGKADIYMLPLPPSLASKTVKRRLCITLAYFSPVVPKSWKYRTAALWFEVLNNGATVKLAEDRQDADWQAVRRGTVQHEVFEGERAEPFIDGATIQIKVNCRKDAGNIEAPVPYGLSVSLEVAEGTDTHIPVYDEIKSRIATRVRPMVATSPSP